MDARHLRLAFEQLTEVQIRDQRGLDHLQRDRVVKPYLVGAKDNAHSSLSTPGLDPVASEYDARAKLVYPHTQAGPFALGVHAVHLSRPATWPPPPAAGARVRKLPY